MYRLLAGILRHADAFHCSQLGDGSGHRLHEPMIAMQEVHIHEKVLQHLLLHRC